MSLAPGHGYMRKCEHILGLGCLRPLRTEARD